MARPLNGIHFNDTTMKIAVTGASGYVGSILVAMLTAQGHSLQLLNRGLMPISSNENTEIIQGDLLQEESLNRLVAGADVVIHSAAVISISDNIDKAAFEVNTKGTDLLLAAAQRAGIKRFIYVSSIAAFEQWPCDEPMNENRGTANALPYSYAASKGIAQAAALACNSDNFEVLVLAPSAIAGPFDQRPSLMGKGIISMYKGNLPAIFPGGVDFVDVRDVAAAIVSALTGGEPGNAYLLCGEWLSLQALNQEIAAIKGKKRITPVLPLRLVLGLLPLINLWARITNRPPVYTRQAVEQVIYSNKHIDHSKATAALNFKPRPIAETIRDEVEWFKQNGFFDH